MRHQVAAGSARKASDIVAELYKEKCAVVREIEGWKVSQPNTLNAADDKNKMLTYLASRRDTVIEKLREAQVIKDQTDEKAQAAMALFEGEKFARDALWPVP